MILLAFSLALAETVPCFTLLESQYSAGECAEFSNVFEKIENFIRYENCSFNGYLIGPCFVPQDIFSSDFCVADEPELSDDQIFEGKCSGNYSSINEDFTKCQIEMTNCEFIISGPCDDDQEQIDSSSFSEDQFFESESLEFSQKSGTFSETSQETFSETFFETTLNLNINDNPKFLENKEETSDSESFSESSSENVYESESISNTASDDETENIDNPSISSSENIETTSENDDDGSQFLSNSINFDSSETQEDISTSSETPQLCYKIIKKCHVTLPCRHFVEPSQSPTPSDLPLPTIHPNLSSSLPPPAIIDPEVPPDKNTTTFNDTEIFIGGFGVSDTEQTPILYPDDISSAEETILYSVQKDLTVIVNETLPKNWAVYILPTSENSVIILKQTISPIGIVGTFTSNPTIMLTETGNLFYLKGAGSISIKPPETQVTKSTTSSKFDIKANEVNDGQVKVERVVLGDSIGNEREQNLVIRLMVPDQFNTVTIEDITAYYNNRANVGLFASNKLNQSYDLFNNKNIMKAIQYQNSNNLFNFRRFGSMQPQKEVHEMNELEFNQYLMQLNHHSKFSRFLSIVFTKYNKLFTSIQNSFISNKITYQMKNHHLHQDTSVTFKNTEIESDENTNDDDTSRSDVLLQVTEMNLKALAAVSSVSLHITNKFILNASSSISCTNLSVSSSTALRFVYHYSLNNPYVLASSTISGVPGSIVMERFGTTSSPPDELYLVCGHIFENCSRWADSVNSLNSTHFKKVQCKHIDNIYQHQTATCLSAMVKDDSNDENGKLSGGEIAGIVIGVLCIVAIIVVVIVFFLVIKKRREDDSSESQSVAQLDSSMNETDSSS
ncbi:hypothetical protein TRFO_37732 [Tritrichomonas foetus]|uniref:Uncharacterized protein n=1 Tax=Tritrichomonas foetus TaxID=1144522 RepID=A0A1J4JCX8_9EUKA|nr:hypothetical protein TRFO_37732 [Tritrichomonas foetus]|eukprot:OHS96119.1 hypothetical protein TRFO_37732 [Tritrichomonas foetus]